MNITRTRILICSSIVLVLLVAGCGGSDGNTTGEPGEIAFDLETAGAGGASGVRATLTFENRDSTTIVVDGLDEGESAGGGPNPVWLKSGSCSDLGDILFDLEPLQGSTSQTTVGLGLAALLNGEYAVEVGLTKSQPEEVACGDVPDEAPDAEGDS